MSRALDSLDRLLKIAAAQDPGAAAMAAAAQTAGGAPGAVPAPNMPPPPEEEQGPSPDALQLQKEVAKRDKEISDLRSKVQDAKNQASLVEMKQQMSEEQNKMRDAMRKEYTQMQEKLRAQQKELDNRQSQFKQEEANHKAVMTANEAQHKSRLAEIANNHKTTLQQQVADQKITLAQNEAKSLQDIANQQSQSRMQQADEYVAMTDKARKDADRVMQEKEKRFAATHPAVSPLLQGRINDATSAISRLSKKNSLVDGPLYKAATANGVKQQAPQQQQPQQQQPQQQQPQPNEQRAAANQAGQLMAQANHTYKPSANAQFASMDELNRMDRRDKVYAGYDQQFGANSDNVADADMGVARAENALARAKAEGNQERVSFLQSYINRRKSQVTEKEKLTRMQMNAGSVDARADLADYKLQNKRDLLGKGTWYDPFGIFQKGQSDRDRAANRWKQEQEDKKSRESWWNNGVTRFFTEPWHNLKQSINDANKSRQAANIYGAKTHMWADADFDDETMKERYNQAVKSRGLTQSYLGTLGNVAMNAIDPVLDVAAGVSAAGAMATGVGAGAGVGILAANAARKAAIRAARQGVQRVAKSYMKKKLINAGIGAGIGAGIHRYQTGQWKFSMPGAGAGYKDTRYGQYGTTGGAGGYDSSTGRYYDASGQSRDDSDTSMTYSDMVGRQQYYGQ